MNLKLRSIKKILIANRGEIAIRIIRAARELGIGTVAIYSEPDKYALHVRMADECMSLKFQDMEPYLDIDQIIDIAKQVDADAIHPGYGFLSENAAFAQAVENAGINYIGPSHQAIALMGDKVAAKKLAASAGVPIIPGFLVDTDDTVAIANRIEKEIGFPVLIKARAGGGGRGMRLVSDPTLLADSLAMAHREAQDAFRDGQLFIEKYIVRPRHIEIQILADEKGNTIHLFERECSIQRRHQKVVEEAPSIILTDELRSEMGECAVNLARACNYKNAGTIEFVLDEQMQFFFLEMNTRLQVEHPVTELICGVDLVKLQIKIAEGHTLPITQKSLKIHGHAIELRVYAEDPANGFLPDIGKLQKLRFPDGPGIRVDSGYEEGMEIPVEYDPLIAKLICHGATRPDAIARMHRAINEFRIEGVQNTLQFGRFVMEDPDFRKGKF
ncbi:MAG: acetyl-CoA carboxylase biotin carboxylase subunit [Cyclobacteriaceae bacterium]|nr:acetyl-CoA carboxylase biotin carboxylase subunit [Cyclobacteriaceae bacterium]